MEGARNTWAALLRAIFLRMGLQGGAERRPPDGKKAAKKPAAKQGANERPAPTAEAEDSPAWYVPLLASAVLCFIPPYWAMSFSHGDARYLPHISFIGRFLPILRKVSAMQVLAQWTYVFLEQ